MNPSEAYLDKAIEIIQKIKDTEMEPIEEAAELFANTIANDGLVHMFATGHSRMFIEEMYPRHGSFPGFHPIVELSLTYHTQVVGANGQRQAMFIEHVEGFGEVILNNFVFTPPDCFIVISNSGVNEVVVDVALGAKRRGLPLVVIVSKEHSGQSSPKHSSGKKLMDLGDIVIDNCTPPGDALVTVDGMPDDPVGPASTIGTASVINAIKCLVAEKLVKLGKPPHVLTNAYFVGKQASAQRFDASYNDYRRRVKKVYG